MHERLSRLDRRDFLKGATLATAGLWMPDSLLGSGPAPQNLVPLYNWFTANNTSTNANTWLGLERGLNAYYPYKDSIANWSSAQRGVFVQYGQSTLSLVGSSGLNSALQQTAKANYINDWVTFVSVGWQECYDFWDTWYLWPYDIAFSEDAWYNVWDLYYVPTFPLYSVNAPPANSWPAYLYFSSLTAFFTSNVWSAIKNLTCGTTGCAYWKEMALICSAAAMLLAGLAVPFPAIAPVAEPAAAAMAVLGTLGVVMSNWCKCS